MSDKLIVRKLGRVPYEVTMREMQDFTQQRTVDTEDECWICEHDPVFTLGQSMAGENVAHSQSMALSMAEDPVAGQQIKNIPIVQSDRGGKITYHGPGQIVAYLMIDLRAKGISVRSLIENSEQAIINLCESYGIAAHTMEEPAMKDTTDVTKDRTLGDATERTAKSTMECTADEAMEDRQNNNQATINAASKKTSKMPGVYIRNKKVSSLGYRIKGGCSYHGISINHSMDLRPFSWIDVCGYPKLEVTQLKDHEVDVAAAELIQALIMMICQAFNFSPPNKMLGK